MLGGLFGFKKRTKPLVLHIDDDADILALVANFLEAMNLDSLGASNGPDGIALARKQLPDLIISDVRMPGMDGFDLCVQLKADAKTKDIPVLMMTAMGQTRDIDRGLGSGADGYLVKPIQLPQFKAKVASLLAKKGAPPA